MAPPWHFQETLKNRSDFPPAGLTCFVFVVKCLALFIKRLCINVATQGLTSCPVFSQSVEKFLLWGIVLENVNPSDSVYYVRFRPDRAGAHRPDAVRVCAPSGLIWDVVPKGRASVRRSEPGGLQGARLNRCKRSPSLSDLLPGYIEGLARRALSSWGALAVSVCALLYCCALAWFCLPSSDRVGCVGVVSVRCG